MKIRGEIVIFSFFQDLYQIDDIREAFQKICWDKFASDGYFDMSIYIYKRMKKKIVYETLLSSKSKYADLYNDSFPNKDNAYKVWNMILGQKSHKHNRSNCNLTYYEASAIVNWVYSVYIYTIEREQFTERFSLWYTNGQNIRFTRGVIYDHKRVDLFFLSSIAEFNNTISGFNNSSKESGLNNIFFYLGHSNSNFVLCPSIKRKIQYEKNEHHMYNRILIECPHEFSDCSSHLEKLVKMQHYGLPTRLLDITKNPLVALFFACVSHNETYGEVVVISSNKEKIKYPQSDTISIISSLPKFSFEEQKLFEKFANDKSITKEEFNKKISRLIHEVRLEKPAFKADVEQADILNSYIVYAIKNNPRIVKQDGAFVLCGLGENNSLERYRYCQNNKKVVLLSKKVFLCRGKCVIIYVTINRRRG